MQRTLECGDIRRSEERLILLVNLALGTNRVYCKPCSCNCGVLWNFYRVSSVLSAYHLAARLVEHIASLKTEFLCGDAHAKPKRRRSPAQISYLILESIYAAVCL